MSEHSDVVPGAADADRQEQTLAEDAGIGTAAAGGTGGSEADRQEQDTPLDAGARWNGVGIAGEGTGGSEADRLEQAADVPLDAEDAFPYAGGDDAEDAFPEDDGDEAEDVFAPDDGIDDNPE
ncbi:hypothetical protein [Arthrobacter pityocampae]|uniref:hypothetical protein n=1 Tax=Arthrobacter pityocampae TaxID=547334 RepID=UPI0011B0F317|nr:hypothetical protein [Arthrobacter pityocampae]